MTRSKGGIDTGKNTGKTHYDRRNNGKMDKIQNKRRSLSLSVCTFDRERYQTVL